MSRFLRSFSLLLLIAAAATAAQEGVRSLTILHTNDLHARLMPDAQDRGGFARLATAIRREQQGCDSCLLVNAGDLVQGTPVSTLFRGLPVYELARLFRFDVSTIGNHEFDYGWEMASRFLKTAKEIIRTALPWFSSIAMISRSLVWRLRCGESGRDSQVRAEPPKQFIHECLLVIMQVALISKAIREREHAGFAVRSGSTISVTNLIHGSLPLPREFRVNAHIGSG